VNGQQQMSILFYCEREPKNELGSSTTNAVVVVVVVEKDFSFTSYLNTHLRRRCRHRRRRRRFGEMFITRRDEKEMRRKGKGRTDGRCRRSFRVLAFLVSIAIVSPSFSTVKCADIKT
jgi:hypothetical protein